MGTINEESTFEEDIYQLETDDPVEAGEPTFDEEGNVTGGWDNAAISQLANRTKWIKSFLDALGDFKLNATLVDSDLDTFRTSGIYYKDIGDINGPENSRGFVIVVDKTDEANRYTIQLFIGSASDGEFYYRYHNNSNWTGWAKIGTNERIDELETWLDNLQTEIETTLWDDTGFAIGQQSAVNPDTLVDSGFYDQVEANGTAGTLFVIKSVRNYSTIIGEIQVIQFHYSAGIGQIQTRAGYTSDQTIGSLVFGDWNIISKDKITTPVAMIRLFPDDTVGGTIGAWLRCDGGAVSRTTYGELFSAIGTDFGVGDGSTTFNLPDLSSSEPHANIGYYINSLSE